MSQYGQGRYYASQRLALEQLREYLSLAERNDLKGLLDMIETNTQEVEKHPNAVILEAVLMLNSIGQGMRKSMVGYANAMLKDFGERSNTGASIYIPSPRGLDG